MSKQIALMGYNKTLLCDTKEQTADTQKQGRDRAGEFQMHYTEWKKPDSKDDILNDSTWMTVWKRQNPKAAERPVIHQG